VQQHRILVQYCWVAVVLEVEKLVVVVVVHYKNSKTGKTT
jgi:hypothetical protein